MSGMWADTKTGSPWALQGCLLTFPRLPPGGCLLILIFPQPLERFRLCPCASTSCLIFNTGISTLPFCA